MKSRVDMLENVSASNKNVVRKVHLPNCQTTLVTYSGSCMILAGGMLKNVLAVPEFKYDLSSVSQLTTQLKCPVRFFLEFCVFQDLFNGEVNGIGKEMECLYYFPSQFYTKSVDDVTDNNKLLITKIDGSSSMLWHNRMGHSSYKVLKQLSLINRDINVEACDDCPIFPLAKQARIPFLISMYRAKAIFDLIHIDVWGPYRFPTHNGFRYFLTIVDDDSRMIWLFLLKFKCYVFTTLKSFFVSTKHQFNRQVKKVRSDNGTEFFNKKCSTMLASLGIIHESSCPHTTHQNGVVERKHRHILEVARAIRFQGSIPIRFWGECVIAVVYLINKMPTGVLQG